MFWFFGHKTCEISAPQLGIEPAPLTLENEVPTTGFPRKLSVFYSFFAFPIPWNYSDQGHLNVKSVKIDFRPHMTLLLCSIWHYWLSFPCCVAFGLHMHILSWFSLLLWPHIFWSLLGDQELLLHWLSFKYWCFMVFSRVLFLMHSAYPLWEISMTLMASITTYIWLSSELEPQLRSLPELETCSLNIS